MEVLYHIRPYFDIFCRAHSPYIALRPPVSSTYLGVRDRSLSPGLKLQSRETQILFTSREIFSIPKKGIDQYPTKISSIIIHYLGLNPLFIYMVSDIYDIIIISSTIFIYAEWLFWSYLIHNRPVAQVRTRRSVPQNPAMVPRSGWCFQWLFGRKTGNIDQFLPSVP